MSNKIIMNTSEMEIINIGLESFYESVKKQGIPCVHVDWKPPASGNARLMEIIDKIRERG